MSNSLRWKTVNGILWSSIERFSSAGINFITGLIIARLLSPHEYGLMAMLAIFIAISQSVIDSGFSNALIRKKDRTEKDFSTTFYFNVVVGLLMYAIIYVSAPVIATFYDSPQLIGIARIVGITLLLGSLSIVQQSILTIQIDFKTQTKISLCSVVLSGGVGIIMALMNYGVWALVYQTLSASFVRTSLLWIVAKWKPSEKFSKSSFQSLFGYGSKLLMAGILETVYRNLYSIIIGKFFQSNVLGIYSRGEQIASYPSSNITGVIQRVTFPILSEVQDERDRLLNIFKQTIRVTCFFVFSLMVYLIVIADPLVRLILTDKWIECVPIIQILCLSFMWYPVHILNLNVLQVKGRSDLFFRIELIKKVVGLIILFVSIPFGVISMCWGRVIYCFIELFINMHYTNVFLHITNLKQLSYVMPLYLYSLLLGAVSIVFCNHIENDILKIIATFILYIAVWMLIVPKIERIDIRNIILIMKNKSN